jgi:retron-type reverse transcriptase
MRPLHVWRSRTPDGVRCAHFPSVITTIMDQKVQLINPLNLSRSVVCGVAEPLPDTWRIFRFFWQHCSVCYSWPLKLYRKELENLSTIEGDGHKGTVDIRYHVILKYYILYPSDLKGHWHVKSVSNKLIGGWFMPSLWAATIFKIF